MKLVSFILAILLPCAVPAFAVVGGQAVAAAVSSQAPTGTIAATPTSIAKGASSVVTVSVKNATQVTLNGSNGSKRTMSATGGSVTVAPTSTTTYTATATGAGGTTTAFVTIAVGTG